MGKISSIVMIFLFVNIIGYMLTAAAVEDGFATPGSALAQFNSTNTFLGEIYAPQSYTSGGTQYTTFALKGVPANSQGGNSVSNQQTIVGSIPMQTPEGFIQQGITFVDRIFALFGFIRVIVGVLTYPLALAVYIGLPWQFTMLLIVPLFFLYVVGLFDLLTGGDN